MAGVIGSNSYLPGQVLKVPEGMMCDQHDDRPAIMRIVGESDSMGSELCDMCEECKQAYLKHIEDHKEEEKHCEICLNNKKDVKPRRDPEEGSCGRLYDMCPECYRKMVDAFCDDDDY